MASVKRIGLLTLAALAFWLVSTTLSGVSSDDASITLESKDPAALRATVIAKVTSWGGRRVGESSSFGEDARSDLRFRVPSTALEQILTGLGQLGATVAEQQVDVDEQTADRELTDRLGRVQRCLGEVADGNGIDAVDGCGEDLRSVRDRLDDTGSAVPETTLAVRIGGTATRSSWTVVAGVLGLLIIAATVAVVIRSARQDADVDVDLRVDDVPPHSDDVYSRRN